MAVDPRAEFCNAPVADGPLKRHLPRFLVTLYRRLKYQIIVSDSAPRTEMFGMPRDAVIALLQSTGATSWMLVRTTRMEPTLRVLSIGSPSRIISRNRQGYPGRD
jgi:hypothetical protein